MMVKRAFVLVVAITLCSVVSLAQSSHPAGATNEASSGVNATAPPVHPATEDQIREYMALTGAAKMMHDLVAGNVSAMRTTSAPYLTAGFWDDMNAEFLKIDFVTYCVPIYQKYLSTEDMAAIISFYRSPPGKRILATQQPIGQEASDVLRKIGGEIGERVYEKHKDEIEAAKKKYESGAQAPLQK